MAVAKRDEATIFNAARRIEDPTARRQYVREACGEDGTLADRIEALLQAHDDDATFLASPTNEFRAFLGAAPAEAAGTQIGPYRLLRPIGEGGMGTVFLAEQAQPVQRQVALKVIRPGMDTRQVLARFEAERQALALMDHPNIARVLDAGTTDAGRPYFVMELIDGARITRFCDDTRLSVRERLALFVPVCQAVQHAHQKGIIHRDLKPSNVLVTLYDGKPVPKVIDFGIAKATGQKLTERTLETQVGSVVGTLEYMSPEQAEPRQLHVDTRSDIYSLGVLLYELLTGTTPLQPTLLDGTALLDLLRAVRESDPPRPSTRLNTTEELSTVAANRGVEPKRLIGIVRGDLDWIVMKCLDKDPARRYETADALARDVERYLNLEPVEACPPSRRYRLRKFARRNRKLLLAAGAFVLLLTTATAVSVWFGVRATLAERKADAERRQAVTEKERADEQAAVAEAVNKFFNGDILIQASPEQSPDRDLKLRTALDRAAEKVDDRLASQPVAAARIHKTLASAYNSLGELELAEKHARRSYELYREKLGPDDPSTVGAMNNLGSALFARKNLEEAEKLYAAAVERARKVFDAEDPVLLAMMANLATVYGMRGRPDEARKLLEETLEVQQRVQGEKSRETLTSMINLAATYKHLGKQDDARRMYEKALELTRQHLSPKDPHSLQCALGLAEVLEAEKNHERANELRAGVLELGGQSLPPEHPILMTARKDLAISLWQLGRYPEAIKRFEDELRVESKVFKPQNPQLLNTMHSVAWLLVAAPDPKDRDPRRAIDLAKELVEKLPKQATRRYLLGVAYYRAGEWKEAITALEKAEELEPKRFLGFNALFLAMAHWKLNERDTARQWYDKAVAWIEVARLNDPELPRFRDEAAQLLGVPPVKKDGP
jgi:serine/threonine protein kinase/Tfp pilus assembly protein PilF